MELTIEVNKSMFQELDHHSITILLYCTAYHQKYNKVPSMKHISNEIKIGYHTIRKSYTQISEFLNDADAHNILYKRFLFLLPTTIKIAENYRNITTNKTDIMEKVWETIVKRAKDYYTNIIVYSKFYWRISVQLKNLLDKIGDENLENYINWYFRIKAPRISYFNSAVFCHKNIISDFNLENKSIKLKQADYDKGYEEESKIEEKKIFESLIKRRDAGTLDEYDEELLDYYKREGWVND